MKGRGESSLGFSRLSLFTLIVLVIVSAYLRVGIAQDISEGHDDWVYHNTALSYLKGNQNRDYYWPQGMPTFLYIMYSLVGINVKPALILLSLLSSILAFLVAWELTKNKWVSSGVLALTLFEPDLSYYSVQLYSETVYALLVLTVVYFTFKMTKKHSPKYPLIVGACIGLGLYQKVYTLGLLLGVFLHLVANKNKLGVGRQSHRRIIEYTLIMLLITTLVIAPRLIQVYSDYGILVFMTASSGINLYIGNNPYSTGCYTYDGLQYNSRLFEKVMPYRGDPLQKYYTSKVVKELALEYIKEDPTRFAKKVTANSVKYWLLPNVYCFMGPRPPTWHTTTLYPKYKILLWITSLTGLILSLREWRKHTVIYSLYATIIGMTLVAFYGQRYLHPILPFQLMFSMYALSMLREKLTDRGFRYRNLLFACTLFFILLVLTGIIQPFGVYELHNVLGVSYHTEGRIDDALTEFKESIARNPNYAKSHMNLGVMYHLRGDFDKAEQEFNKALDLEPDNPKTRTNLGALYLKTGAYDKAEQQLKNVINKTPYYAESYNVLGAVYFNKGLYHQAEEEFERTILIKELELEGDPQEVQKNLEETRKAVKQQNMTG